MIVVVVGVGVEWRLGVRPRTAPKTITGNDAAGVMEMGSPISDGITVVAVVVAGKKVGVKKKVKTRCRGNTETSD